MNWDELKAQPWFQAFVATVVGIFLLRVLLPIITIVIIAGLGLFLVLLFIDKAMGGTAIDQIAIALAAWLQGLF